MGRSTIALFVVSFFVMFIAFWTGVAGCWRRSPGNITATAILVLLACECRADRSIGKRTRILMMTNSFAGLLGAGAMGFWHGVEYYEKERVVGDEFYQQWSNVSGRRRKHTTVKTNR